MDDALIGPDGKVDLRDTNVVESWLCIDCGYNTYPGAPPRALAEFLLERDGKIPMTLTADAEVYMVCDKVWKAAGMEAVCVWAVWRSALVAS